MAITQQIRPALRLAFLLHVMTTNPKILVTGQQLTCNGDFTVERYANGGRFLTDIGAENYDCSCHGENCQQIICIVLKTTEDNSTTDEGETCRDPKTGRTYARGTNFIRYGKTGVNMACTCAAEGSLKINCEQPTCKVPPPPPATRHHIRNVSDSCYDLHNDNWHRYNIPYIRRVVMSYSPDIIAQYKCICNRLSKRCSAIDIPCCDTTTGTFVTKNQRFKTLVRGSLSSCVCLGGRGRVGRCERQNDRRELAGGNLHVVRRHRCLDPRTNRYYHPGATFVQIRRTDERICTCRRKKQRYAISCRRRE